jgi:hypothetical protein
VACNQAHATASVNPFETRWTKPGQMTFLPNGFTSISELTAQIVKDTPRCEILGEHGVGKSSLLRALQSDLDQQSISNHLAYACGEFPHDNPPLKFAAIKLLLRESDVLFVDGFEQLSWWTRRRIISYSVKHDHSLIIACHQTQRLPCLVHLAAAETLVLKLVLSLQQAQQADEVVAASDVREFYQRFGNNVRELLFACYDLYEKRTANG